MKVEGLSHKPICVQKQRKVRKDRSLADSLLRNSSLWIENGKV